MTFWQNIVLKWKEIQQFCLWALPSDPSGLKESGMYYNTTANRAALRDDTKTQLLAHLEDTYKNAGVIKQPTITKGVNSITVGNDAVIRCYKTTDYSGIIQEIVNPTGGTFALPLNTSIWLVYTYGVGYSLVTAIPTGPLSNIIPLYRYFNAFGVIHSSSQDEMAKGAIEKTVARIARTEYFKREGDTGVELSTSGLNVLISGGKIYNGPIEETILPFDSSVNTLYQEVYGDGVWSQNTLSALTNTHYNPSTGLVTLGSNKYTWAYVWRSVGDDTEAFFQLGEKEYATEALAVADLGVMPASIFGLYAIHCVLVGYVLIKQGTTTTQFFSAWGRPTVAGAPVYHNTLAGIDAGDTATPYYGHVKSVDNTRLNAAGAANGFALLGADGKLPSGQLPSYVDDVLEYATKANFPATGNSGKIYVDLATNLTWRWSGSVYVEISPSLALGITSSTAGRGDWTKTAYDHSQITNANPHGTIASQISLVPVGEIASTNVQGAFAELDSEKLSISSAANEYVSKTTTTSQSISSELVTKKSIYNLRTQGTSGTAGYLKVCTITITNSYVNRPLEFTIAQREKVSSATVSLKFAGVSGTDATIGSFTFFGASDHGVYAYKSATATWEIYVKKVENYDNLQVFGFSDPYNNFPNIVWHEDTQVAAIPSGAIQATRRVLLNDITGNADTATALTTNAGDANTPVYFSGGKPVVCTSLALSTSGNAATATKLATARTIELTGDVSGSASFDGSDNVSITAVVADDSHNHVISNIDGLPSELGACVKYQTISYNIASVDSYWCKIGTLYLQSGLFANALLDYSASFYASQHWSYGLIFVQYNTGDTAPSIKLTKINTNSNSTSLVSLYGDWDSTTNVLTLWGAFGGGNGGGTIQCNLLSKSTSATYTPYATWQSATPTWTNQITATKQELTNVAPLSHTHGNLSNDGKLGTTAGLPVNTGTGGVIQAVAWSTTPPVMNGSAVVGTSPVPSRSDHRHPSDTSKFGFAGEFSSSPKIWKGTKAAYNTLGAWDSNTIYMCYT